MECEFNSNRWVKAKTPKVCSECRSSISPGDTYQRSVGKVEGDFWSEYFCKRCGLAMRWLMDRGHAWMSKAILDDVRQCVSEELEERGTIRTPGAAVA